MESGPKCDEDPGLKRHSPFRAFLEEIRSNCGVSAVANHDEWVTAEILEQWEAVAAGARKKECQLWYAEQCSAELQGPYLAEQLEDGVCATSCIGDTFTFGRFSCRSSQAFFVGRLCLAFVNIRPIVPGHVLVISRRPEARMALLSDTELCDVWRVARLVQAALETLHPNASGFNIAVQDGEAAGQSVPHVHVHLIPRCAEDFPRNDEVYERLEDFDYGSSARSAGNSGGMSCGQSTGRLKIPDDAERVNRSEEEMAAEARAMRLAMLQVARNVCRAKR